MDEHNNLNITPSSNDMMKLSNPNSNIMSVPIILNTLTTIPQNEMFGNNLNSNDIHQLQQEMQQLKQQVNQKLPSYDPNVAMSPPTEPKQLNLVTLKNKDINGLITNMIRSNSNSLDKNDIQVMKELYNQYRDIVLTGFSGKSVNELNSSFWLNILVTIMVTVEKIKSSGIKKKDMVIETVCLIIKNDLPIGLNEKNMVVEKFKQIAPELIDPVIFASTHINISPKETKKWFSKIFSCCH
jgi:hypothetical protein